MANVYRHIRKDTNQPFYIGAGISIKRATEKTGRSKAWKEVVAQADYEVEIILDELTLNESREKEKEFIKLYGRVDLGTGTLINRTEGGESGKLKKGYKPWSLGKEPWNKGVVTNESIKLKISESKLGKPLTLTSKRIEADRKKRKAICVYTLKGIFIREYEGCIIAAKEMNLDCGSVSKAANGILRKTGGFIFKYKVQQPEPQM